MVVPRSIFYLLAIIVRAVSSSQPGTQVDASPHSNTSAVLKAQWSDPNEAVTILLLIGGDIVQKAIAQLAGIGPLISVAFSFGWVNFAFYNLLAALGDGYLMPRPATGSAALLINIESGYRRTNSSWILDQILKSVETEVGTTLAPLYVSIYNVYGRSVHSAKRDWRWWMSIGTILLQLLVSAIPYYKDGDYSVLLLTSFGTSLAIIHGSLPQWKKEKWAGRLDRKRGTTV